LSLTVFTGLKMPRLIDDWSHLVAQDSKYQQNLKNYLDFKQNLFDFSNNKFPSRELISSSKY